jgi:hypothetical protein
VAPTRARMQKAPRTGQLIPGTTENNSKDNCNSKNPSLGVSVPPAPARGFPSLPHCAALRLCRPRGFPLSLRSVQKPWVIPLPLHLLPPLAWAWAKA